MNTWLARMLVLAGLAWAGAAAAEDKDLYGDPLPDGAVARLGSVRFRSRDGSVIGLHISADGKTLLTVGGDFSLRRWETSTGRRLSEVGPGQVSGRTVAVSPDGTMIALYGSRRKPGDSSGFEEVRSLVDTASGKEVRRLPMADRDEVHALAFTPDGKLLMSLGGSGILRIEEIASGTELLQQQFPHDVVASLAVSPNGKIVAVWSGPNTRKLYLWDWQGGEEPREVKVPQRGLRCLAFTADGKDLVACGDFEPFVYTWDVATGRMQDRLELCEDVTPAGLAFHPDGKTMAISDSGNQRSKHYSGSVQLVERGTGKVLRELSTPGASAGRVVFSPDGRWLAAVSGGGVHVWDLSLGQEVASGAAGHQGGITQIVTAPGGLIATASDDHTVRVWDAATGREHQRLQHGHWVRAVALSPDGRLLVSSSLDDFVRLWDLESGKELFKLAGHGELGGHRTVAFTPDGQRFLSWGDDLYLRIWDVKTGKALVENAVRPPGVKVAEGDDDRAARGREMKGMMMGPAAFAPDGQRLVASLGGTFHVIDTATGRVEHSLKHPGGNLIASLAFAPDGRHFATSGWGKSIRTKLPDGGTQISTPNHHPVCLVEVATGTLVHGLEMPTSDAGPVAFSVDGKLLAIGFGRGGGGEVFLLDLATHETLAVRTDFGSGPHAMTFSRDGKYLITGLYDQTVLVWDLPHLLAKQIKKEDR